MISGNKYKSIFPLFLLIVIDAMGAGLILTILPDLFSSNKFGLLNVSTSEFARYFLFGLSLSLFPLFVVFSAPWLGKLSDEFGRRKLLIFCSSMNMICYFILAYSVITQHLILFLFGRCLAGCVAGNQPIAQAALVDISKEDAEVKFKNLSIVSIAGAVGVIIGPMLGGVTATKTLLAHYGYSVPFFISAFMSLVNILLLWFFYQDKKLKLEKANSPRFFVNPIKPMLWAIRNEATKYLVLILFFGQASWGLYFQSLVLRLSLEYHFQPSKLGYFLAYIGLCVSFSGMYLGKLLVKRLSINNLVVGSLIMLVLSSLFSGLMVWESAQWICVFFGATAAIIFNSAMLHLFTDSNDNKSAGLVLGITTAVIYFSSIISGLLSGMANYINYSFAPFVSAALASIALIFILNIKNRPYFKPEQSSELITE